ncbi:MAG: CapA family protein [Bacillota bacterium]|nr:CapA family protein [Bacillota bacterium]
MSSKSMSMLAVGDIILGPDAGSYFTYAAPVLKKGDVVVGQLEVPYTTRNPDAVALGRDPEVLNALISVGFDVVTLAGNHIWDAGIEGIEDTAKWLKKHNIAFVGGGMNIDEARSPVIIERNGTRFGFLSYNCVGPKETWAASNRPGCAYVHIITHYELDYATPGGPPAIYTWAEPDTLNAMIDDIQKLRPLCDVLMVSLHKGIGHTPAKLAAYEKQVSYAAIDAGADFIAGHHAHILRGIEFYKGKAIFHGLCNMVAYVPSLAPQDDQDSQSWAKRRREIFGFEPDPEYPTYPFHPEAKYTIIAKCTIEDKEITEVSYYPCKINKQGHPEVFKKDSEGKEVFDYMNKITREAGLNGVCEWRGDEISVRAGS